LFRDEHRAAAVFEPAKAVHNRVKKMTGLSGDGAGLMGNAFKSESEQPALVLADLTSPTGKDIQAGYRFFLMGAQQAIRNPHAHEQVAEMDDDDAFEFLGLARQPEPQARSGKKADGDVMDLPCPASTKKELVTRLRDKERGAQVCIEATLPDCTVKEAQHV
jgi:uncharacterized protein (TIGR02391 family)